MYDYIVIGSGFGGSVSAMRLSEKGYTVLVLEKGKRWTTSDFPKSNWNLPKYLWAPALRFFGFQRLTFFKEVLVLSGVGVGGGSIVYANTLMKPKDSFYSNKLWSHFKDWKTVLAPYFQKAGFMLGSEQFEKEYEEDRILQEVAVDMGKGNSYQAVDGVGVFLGDPNIESDPYFKGLGPLRKGCIHCAGCMVGCRHNAKNTLDKNYLWFAEKIFHAKIQAETEVVKIEYVEGEYRIHSRSSTAWFSKKRTIYRSKGLVVSGGVLGTMDLLLRQKYQYKTLPGLSDKLGDNILTNSEMLSGVMAADRKLNHGVAISRIFAPDEHTNIEIVKYPDGSGLMTRLGVMAAGDGSPAVRTAKMVGNIFLHPRQFLRLVFNFKAATTGIFFLIMQTLENAMRMRVKKGIFGTRIAMQNDLKQRVPTFIPAGQDALFRYAEKVNGVPLNAATEVFFNLASTAHILGGCPMGATIDEGVVDETFKVHGYPDMYILDGSIMPCNLGVNPSLTITALSEYAMDQISQKAGNTEKSLEERLSTISTDDNPTLIVVPRLAVVPPLPPMKFLPIYPDLSQNTAFLDHPDCQDSLQMCIDFYKRVGFEPPWICYYAQVEGVLVGSAAFKGRPKDGKVEIAYGTFPKHQHKGVGAEICRQLVLLALSTDPSVRITARTLPEENYSTRVLRKNGFALLGEVWDEEDGTVWEWEYEKHT